MQFEDSTLYQIQKLQNERDEYKARYDAACDQAERKINQANSNIDDLQIEIESYKAKCDRLDSENQALEAEIAECNKSLESRKDTYLKFEQELKQDYEQFESDANTVKLKYYSERKATERLRLKITDLKDNLNRKMELQQAEYEASVSGLEDRIRIVEEKLSSKSEELENSRNNILSLERSLKEEKETSRGLMKKFDAAELSRINIQVKYDELQSEHHELSRKLKWELDQERNNSMEFSQKFISARSEKNQLSVSLKDLEARLAAKEDLVSIQRNHLREDKEKVFSLEREKGDLHLANVRLQSQLKQAEKDYEAKKLSLRRELDASKADTWKLKKKCEDLKAKLEQSKKSLSSKESDLKNLGALLKTSQKSRHTEVEGLRQQINEAFGKHVKEMRDLRHSEESKRKEEIEAWENRMDASQQSFEAEKARLLKESDAYKEELRQVKSEIAKKEVDFSDEASKLQTNLDDWKKKYERMESSWKSLSNDASNLEIKIHDLERQIKIIQKKEDEAKKSLNEEIKKLEKSCSSKDVQISRAQALIKTKERTIVSEAKKLEQSNKHTRKLQDDLKDIRNKLELHQRVVDDLKLDKKADVQRLDDIEARYKKLQGSLDNQSAKLTQSQNSVADLQKKNQDFKAQVADLLKKALELAEAKKRIITLQNDVKGLHEDKRILQGDIQSLEKLKTSMEELKREKQQLQMEKNNMDKLYEDCSKNLKILQNLKTTVELENADNKQKIAEFTAKFHKLDQEKKSDKEAKAALQEKLEESNRRRLVVERNLKQEQAARTDEKVAFDTQIEELKKEGDECRERIKDLTAETEASAAIIQEKQDLLDEEKRKGGEWKEGMKRQSHRIDGLKSTLKIKESHLKATEEMLKTKEEILKTNKIEIEELRKQLERHVEKEDELNESLLTEFNDSSVHPDDDDANENRQLLNFDIGSDLSPIQERTSPIPSSPAIPMLSPQKVSPIRKRSLDFSSPPAKRPKIEEKQSE